MPSTEQDPREEGIDSPKDIEGDQGPANDVEYPSDKNSTVEEEDGHFHTTSSKKPEARNRSSHLSRYISRPLY